MNFEEKLKTFIPRIEELKGSIETEEATKMSLIVPFFQLLGYDVFNPNEFTPEFTADIGIKKGEKVDYAIQLNNMPVILIECKNITEQLEKHDSQLFRYFGTSTAKFAILTNGIVYRFYTDIEETNKMDEAPFLEIDLLNLKEHLIPELQKFTKEIFDPEQIFSTAEELKYMNQIRTIIKEELNDPSDDLVRLLLSRGIYDGVKTQNIVERFQPLVKKSFTLILTERINERLQNALNSTENITQLSPDDTIADDCEDECEHKIITTQEELDSYYAVKSILRSTIQVNRITYTDKETYFSINIDKKTTKWICRIYIKERIKYIIIPDDEKVPHKFEFETIDDLYNLDGQLKARLNSLL